MNIDHIFIFTDEAGKIADELVEFGLTEGSNRIHVGQGTANRKFYFDNFFLEILWVYDQTDIKSDLTKPTGLWQRADFKQNDFSPFGLCIIDNNEIDALFENSFKYQPNYFPQGMSIDIIKNEFEPDLPWTSRLPFKGQKKPQNEPINHKNGLKLLTKARFEYQHNTDNAFLSHFENDNHNHIEFVKTSRIWLYLTFDNGKQGQKRDFEKLKMTIQY